MTLTRREQAILFALAVFVVVMACWCFYFGGWSLPGTRWGWA